MGEWRRTMNETDRFSIRKWTWRRLCMYLFTLLVDRCLVGRSRGNGWNCSRMSWGLFPNSYGEPCWQVLGEAHCHHRRQPVVLGCLGWRGSQGMGASELKPRKIGANGHPRLYQCLSRILLILLIQPQWALRPATQSRLAVQGSSLVLPIFKSLCV